MVTLEDILAARRRVAEYVKRTPLERSSTLSELLGTNVYLKLENLQKTGSFKPRGAFNQILELSSAQKERGVVAVSAGNFAQGVGYAGRLLGIQTVVCMPSTTPENYIEATRGYGAEVALAPTLEQTFELVEEYKERGWGFAHAWDHPLQVAGNGTIGLELVEDLPEMTDVIVSIGGGGLIAGVTTALKALKPGIRLWGVETEGAESMGQALKAGRVVTVEPTSLARTLGAPYVSEEALTVARRFLEGYCLVSDAEAFAAQVLLLERAKVVTELAASCTLAALERLRERFSKRDHVVLLICGGNDSLANMVSYHRLFAEQQEAGQDGARPVTQISVGEALRRRRSEPLPAAGSKRRDRRAA